MMRTPPQHPRNPDTGCQVSYLFTFNVLKLHSPDSHYTFQMCDMCLMFCGVHSSRRLRFAVGVVQA